MLGISDFIEIQDKMIGMAIYNGAGSETARDIVQELLTRLCELEKREGNLDRISFKGKPNHGYIFNAIRNLMITHRTKKTKLNNDADLPDIAVLPVSDTEIDVTNKLKKLGYYYEKLFMVYVNEKHSLRSMSRATGISVSTLFYELRFIKNELKTYLNAK